jgi:hypothetical protein
MDIKALVRELRRVLIRYRVGMISLEECRQEQSLLLAMIRAYEMIVIEERISRLEAAIEDRR